MYNVTISGEKTEYLYKKQFENVCKISEYKDTDLIVACNKKTTVIPTANLTAFREFSNLYIDTKQNIVRDNINAEVLAGKGKYVIYIPTDTNWLNVQDDTDKYISDIIGKGAKYQKIEDGSLGEFYLIRN